MNKRGSHVGAMLSFVIFITFLIFLYSILQPALKIEGSKEDMVDYLTGKLRENFTEQLLSISITINEAYTGDYISSGKSCLNAKNILTGIEQPSIGLNRDLLIIKNSSNSILPYIIETDDLSIKTGLHFDGFFKVYSSKYIETSKCPTCGISGCYLKTGTTTIPYTITSVGQMNETFLKKARRFKEDYELTGAYETIKTQLKVPENIEFSFTFRTAEGEIIEPSKVPPTGANIYVGETPILYIDESANLEPGFLTLKVW
ncbi:MAG: hypothetical protein Q7S06_02400 [Nanoarchaeota archaeon]|nr:hypothetical protein [Nanoarchaeota archaeon]